MSPEGHSYRQALRSLFIMGGAAGFNYLIGLVRIKIVAVLLGPSGVGLIGLYASAIGLLGTISGLGITGSAVREVALASGEEDARAIGRTFRILRRTCWATGMLGWLLAVLLAKPLSIWLFNSTEHVIALSIVGVTLLLNSLAAARQALLQGLRRVEDVARANVLGTLLSTAVAIGLFAWLGEQGILPVLVTTALISLATIYWVSRRVCVISPEVSWEDTLKGTKRLLALGIAFMLLSLDAAGLDTLTRSIVTNGFGVDAAGIYQAAWALSGTFAGVILAAMGTEFYPLLSAVIHDDVAATRVVNQHLEIGILMALPAVVGTLLFAPAIMEVAFTRQFLSGAELLQWMMLGVLCKAISAPMNFIPLAKGAVRWIILVDLFVTSVQIALLFFLEHLNGLVGVAQAIATTWALHVVMTLWVGHRLIGFTWSRGVVRLAGVVSGFIVACFIVPLLTDGTKAVLVGGVLTLLGCVVSLRGLSERLDLGSPLIKTMASFASSLDRRAKIERLRRS